MFAAGAATFLVMCFALAFLGQAYQSDYNPENTPQSFRLEDYPEDLHNNEGVDLLAEEAKQLRVNLYRTSLFELDGFTGSRLMFVFVGDPGAFPYRIDPATGQALEQYIPDFNPDRSTLLRPYTMFGTSASTGEYGSSSTGAQLKAFQSALEAKGFQLNLNHTRSMPASPSPVTVLFVSNKYPDPGVMLVFVISGFLLAASSLHVAFRRYRAAMLRRAEGQRLLPTLLKEYGAVLLAYGLITAGAGALGSLGIWLYNGGTLLARLLALYGLLVLVGVGIVVFFQSLAFLLLACKPLALLLRGWKPRKLLVTVGYAGLLLAFFLAGQGAVSVVKNAGPLVQLIGDQSTWQNERDVVAGTTDLSTYFGKDTGDKDLLLRYAWAMRQLDDQGKALVASATEVSPTLDLSYFSPEEREALKDIPSLITVNNAYLARHPVYAADGKRIEKLPEEVGVLYFLVPEDLKGSKKEQHLVDKWTKKSADGLTSTFEGIQIGHELDAKRASPEAWAKYGLKPKEVPSHLDIKFIYTKSEQKLFTYSLFNSGSLVIKDPILVFRPLKSGLWNAEDYPAKPWPAVFATDQKLLLEKMQEAGVQVEEIISPALQNLGQITEQISFLRNAVGVAVLALLLAVISGGVLALSYVDKSRRKLFVRSVHGQGFIALHWRFLSGLAGFNLVAGLMVFAVKLNAVPVPFLFGRLGEHRRLPVNDFQLLLVTEGYILVGLITLVAAALVCGLQVRKLRVESLKEGG